MKGIDVRIFEPLPAGHPAIGQTCVFCEKVIDEGDNTMLIPDDPRESGTVQAGIYHADCGLWQLMEWYQRQQNL